MKKIIFIIAMIIADSRPGSAQTAIVTRLVIPAKTNIVLINKPATVLLDHAFISTGLFEEPGNSLLYFNDQPLIKINGPMNRPVLITTELSFFDVLENSMNNIKTGLVNTYDDHITELFKDAPSLFKVKCIISF